MNKHPELHICIATGQNLSNLIPALHYGATEVWILQTPEMEAGHSASHLRDALKSRNIACIVRNFPSDSVEAMNSAVEQIAEELDAAQRFPAINISGGTKLMTLSLVQGLAAMLDTGNDNSPVHIVYTDTQRQLLEWLRPLAKSDPMKAVLEVPDVLRVNGYRIKTSKDDNLETHARHLDDARDRKSLTQEVVRTGSADTNFQSAVSMLSLPASKVVNRLKNSKRGSLSQKLEYPPASNKPVDRAALRYFRLLEDNHLIAYRADKAEVEFMTADAAWYCAGGWLEEFVALKADAAPIRGEWRFNLEVETVENRTLNEIDLMVVHDNRTLVVECKAAKLDNDNINDWLSKLKDLAERVGGSQVTPMLVSMRELNEHQIKRAQDLGVQLCHGPDLEQMGAHLRAWLSGGTA